MMHTASRIAMLLPLSLTLSWGAEVQPEKPAEPEAPKPQVNEVIPDSPLAMLATARKHLAPLQAGLIKETQARNLAAVEALCRRMIEQAGKLPDGHYNLACILALQDKPAEALDSLARAVELGFNNRGHIEADPDLASLRDNPRFRELAAAAVKARPAWADFKPRPRSPRDQTVWVEDSNVAIHPQFGLPFATYQFEKKVPAGTAVTTINGPAGDLLRQWFEEGTAAGNWGDLYDNRDGDHSDIERKNFPQMTWIEYSEHARDAHLHWGLANSIYQHGLVIGNASVAQTHGLHWRSTPRQSHENQNIANLHYVLYGSNKLYVYPGHVDHSPGRNGKRADANGGHGDVFPANTPYLIASQGSSGSDRVFLEALFATLAAFRPETKGFIHERGLIAPTLQAIFRASNKMVIKPDDYLTGAAHPPVFQGNQIDIERMVRAAHEMTPETVPPLVQLKVDEEDKPVNGRDFFAETGRSEVLFDTPCAIARVFRGVQQKRRMVVNAAGSKDPNQRALTYRWVVLRGDASRIKLQPLTDDGAKAELIVPYHSRFPIAPGNELESNRVDIGVFAHNGTAWSAPAIITFFSLDHEERVYDAQDRIASVTYTGAGEPGNYVDPLVDTPKSWRDEYRYDGSGNCTGWIRRRGEASEEFNAEGKLLARSGPDQPPQLVAVHYGQRLEKDRPVLVQVVTK